MYNNMIVYTLERSFSYVNFCFSNGEIHANVVYTRITAKYRGIPTLYYIPTVPPTTTEATTLIIPSIARNIYVFSAVLSFAIAPQSL